MKCLCCESPDPEYRFDVLEVHTLHVRDFDGEKLIQALGEKKRFEVCTACAQSELRAVLFPAGRIALKCVGFGVLFLAGIALTLALSFRDIMPALRVIGPLAVFVGISGTVSVIRKVFSEREELSGKPEADARRMSAWRCVLASAPKKHGDNDITYIPIDEAGSLTPEALAAKYDLLSPIARKAYESIHKE